VHATTAGSTGSRLSQLSWPSSSILRQKKFKLQRKKKSSQNHRFCHKIPSKYINRDAIKKKRRKAQQHKLAKDPTFVSCVATAKKNIYSKRRKQREKKREGRNFTKFLHAESPV
jgi:hypothetical protein